MCFLKAPSCGQFERGEALQFFSRGHFADQPSLSGKRVKKLLIRVNENSAFRTIIPLKDAQARIHPY